MDSLSVKSVTIELEWAHLTEVLLFMLCMLSLLEYCTPYEPSIYGHLDLFFEFFCLYGAH